MRRILDEYHYRKMVKRFKILKYVARIFFIFCYRSYLEEIIFVSGNNASIQHPLIYKHPIRNDDTIMLALGTLSGRYMKVNADKSKSELSEEETQLIQGK